MAASRQQAVQTTPRQRSVRDEVNDSTPHTITQRRPDEFLTGDDEEESVHERLWPGDSNRAGEIHQRSSRSQEQVKLDEHRSQYARNQPPDSATDKIEQHSRSIWKITSRDPQLTDEPLPYIILVMGLDEEGMLGFIAGAWDQGKKPLKKVCAYHRSVHGSMEG